MKYDCFEDLPVWQAAIDLATRVYRLTRDGMFSGTGDLRDQLRRAALSVSNNIAEGFERGTTAELHAYLYIARGSAGEVRSMLRFVDRLCDERQASSHQTSDLKSQISNLKSEIAELVELSESCSRQLHGWAASLQNSDIKGVRHLNDQARAVFDSRKRADAFRIRLDELNRQNLDRWTEEIRSAREPKQADQANEDES
jgi:four helix bundle protein